MKTSVHFVSVKCNPGTPYSERKAVAIRDENGNLKYHMLISMLRDGAVIPDAWTLQLLLEVLEYYDKIPRTQKRVSTNPRKGGPGPVRAGSFEKVLEDLKLEQNELH